MTNEYDKRKCVNLRRELQKFNGSCCIYMLLTLSSAEALHFETANISKGCTTSKNAINLFIFPEVME